MLNLLTKKIYLAFIKYRKLPKALRKEAVAIALSGMFDEKYYRKQYPDVKEAGIDPLKHYIRNGWKEGRNPSKDYDTSFYLATYPDVRDAGINPVHHYIKYGKTEGRITKGATSKSGKYTYITPVFTDEIKEETKSFANKPLISIITPVYNIDPKCLKLCIESVKKQWYENWELCIADDASIKKETLEYLKQIRNPKIKIKYLPKNQNISGASNEALSLASGDYVALLDHDDELTPDALYEVVKCINKTGADFIYSDEDKLDMNGKRCDAFFKPDWSPDLFLSVMYTCHLGVYRKSIVDKIAGFRVGYEGSQDYDFVLRFIECTTQEKIAHIPKILYHWRKIPGSIASDPKAKNFVNIQSAKKALYDYLLRQNIKGSISDGKWISSYRVRRKIAGKPKVSIIIPTRDKLSILQNCIESIISKTTYKNYELIIVNNRSVQQDTINYLNSFNGIVVSYEEEFNFSAICNLGAMVSTGNYILFLNNDTKVITPDWIESLLEHAQRPDVGAVGCKLLYKDNTIQHAGVVLGLSPDPKNKVAGHIFIKEPSTSAGYFGLSNVVRNYSALTAAAMMVRKDVFIEIGGFDENLAVSFNDVDLCLKMRNKKYLIVYTPYAELFHFENTSRGSRLDEHEVDFMLQKWGNVFNNDPYFNINLSLKKTNCEVNIN